MFDDAPPIYARHVLCVLGAGLDFDLLADIAAKAGGDGFTVDRPQSEPVPDMDSAFRASLTTASFTEDDWDAVDDHDCVAYVLSPPLRPGTQVDLSRRMLAVTAALLREGGVTAAKNESSVLAHGRDLWLALADDADEAELDAELLPILRAAFVKRPIYDGEVFYSRGMHLLGAADVELHDDELADPELLQERAELMDAFADYLLTEPRAHEIADGQAFRLTPDEPRWILRHVPDERVDFDDIEFNLNGFWRMTPDD